MTMKIDTIDSMGRMKTIGDLLKSMHVQRIKELDKTLEQNELADWFGIEPGLFNKYYNDKRTPSGENLEKIAAKAGPIAYKLAGQMPAGIVERIMKIPPDDFVELEKTLDDFMKTLNLEETDDTL
jgi:hypothetical protein